MADNQMKRSNRSSDDITNRMSTLRHNLHKSMILEYDLSISELVNELNQLNRISSEDYMNLDDFVKARACSFKDDLTDFFVLNYGRYITIKESPPKQYFFLIIACYLNHLMMDSTVLRAVISQMPSLYQDMEQNVDNFLDIYEKEKSPESINGLRDIFFIANIVMNILGLKSKSLNKAKKILKYNPA